MVYIWLCSDHVHNINITDFQLKTVHQIFENIRLRIINHTVTFDIIHRAHGLRNTDTLVQHGQLVRTPTLLNTLLRVHTLLGCSAVSSPTRLGLAAGGVVDEVTLALGRLTQVKTDTLAVPPDRFI